MFGLTERRTGPRTEEHTNTKARNIGLVLLAFALPALLIFLVYRFQFRQLTDPDVMDMAQVARNLANGKGFTTSAVRPLDLTYSKDVFRMPDRVHAPLYPAALMLTLATGSSDGRVLFMSVLFFFLTIPVLYRLTKSMFNQKVAQFTLAAYALSALMMNVVMNAGTGMMLGFLFTTLCLFLFRYAQAAAAEEGTPDTRVIVRMAALTGVMLALCYLTDYMLLFALLPVALTVYLSGGQQRKVGLAAFLVGFLVPAGFWMIRNLMVGTNPFFGMRILEIGMLTSAHPGMSLYQTTEPQTLLGLLQEVKGQVIRKALTGMGAVYQALPNLGQAYLMPFFLVGLFYSFRRAGVNAVRGMALASVLCVALCGSLFALSSSTLTAFVPIMLAFAAAYFIRLLTDARLPSVLGRGVMAVAIVLIALPQFLSLALNHNRIVADRRVEVNLKDRVPQNVPILTDSPAMVAFFSEHTCIGLPSDEKGIEKVQGALNGQNRVMGALYLTQAANSAGTPGWANVYQRAAAEAVTFYNTEFRQGGFAKMDRPPLDGFVLYRGMSKDDAKSYLQHGALLFLRPEDVLQGAK